MYKYNDHNNSNFSLHDCRVKHISYKNDILSFIFHEGFWVLPNTIYNKTNNVVCTDTSQIDFKIIDNDIDIYVFKERKNGTIIREEWNLDKFIDDVNYGKYELEFINEYIGYKSRLYKCCIWFDREPYHYECEIVLRIENDTYMWNHLKYDHIF